MFKKKLDFSKKKEANTEMNHVFGSIHLKLFANLKKRSTFAKLLNITN